MTVKFQYTNNLGINTEAEAFTTSEFVTIQAPNSPVMTGANGKIDASLLPETAMAKAASLVVTRKCHGSISRGDAVSPYTSGFVQIADSKLTIDEASVFGIALQSGTEGQDIEIIISGIMIDALFSVFAVNDYLFLDDNGAITNDRPLSSTGHNFLTDVAKALGGNEIFVNIGKPIKLGV